MTTDIAERLRDPDFTSIATCKDAADEIKRLRASERSAWNAAVERDEQIERLRAEVATLREALHEVAEEWAGAECGEPVHAQEAYAIALAKRMYGLASSALTKEKT